MPSETTAPPEIALLEAFLNTLGERAYLRDPAAAVDEFSSPAVLRDWLAAHALLDEDETLTEADLALAKRLRDALRRAIDARHRGSLGSELLADLDRLTEAVPLRARFTSAGEPLLEPATDGARGALGHILAAAVLAKACGTWSRLKVCAARDCRWVFFDQSKNASRRWCSMEVCGNRVKTRAYRARKGTGNRE